MTKTGKGLNELGTGDLAGSEHVRNVGPPTPDQIRRAQKAVAQIDATNEEKAMLLRMLGIHERVE